MISALKAAEAEKSTLCIENDPIGAALVELVRKQAETGETETSVSGMASELVDLLQAHDGKSFYYLTPRKFSRALSRLWPHLEQVLKASRETVHGGAQKYTFSPRQ